MNVKLEDIAKKYPFVYEIRDNYYIIGYDVFEICKSSSAICFYNDYKNEIKSLGREVIQQHNYVNPEKYNSLVYNFRKVKAYADVNIPPEESSTNRINLYDFLDDLNPSEKDILLQQLEDYVATFWYYNRMF